MSAVWTKEMAEEFLAKSSPDPMFPCLSDAWVARYSKERLRAEGADGNFWPAGWDTKIVRLERDEFGRCGTKVEDIAEHSGTCANCNCRMLFNQLECVKADLETTKETLTITSVNLDDTMVELGETRIALEECKKERNEEKRKFSAAIATMVQSEMSDVRTQLTALNLCLKDELGEKSLAKAATSEAVKAALSASKFITLRLLMF